MFPIIDLIAAVGGLIVPPAFDFIKKKFVKASNDTPERTMGSLATTKPEVLPDYVKALATYSDAKVKFFNRDVIGQASQWVVDLRASIRPIGVIASFVILIAIAGEVITDIEGVRLSCEVVISSWFGSRISLSK